MRFFVPQSPPGQADETWHTIADFVRRATGQPIGDRRIYRLRYTLGGDTVTAQVGEPDPHTGEPVIVILDSDPYLICTPNRGVLEGLPLLIDRPDVLEVVQFDCT
jgi:hypothetical protein